MFTNVNADCCETPGCKNSGSLNSRDHVAQGRGVLYHGRGYSSPVISEQSLNTYRNIVDHSQRGLICQCSTCGDAFLKRYGYSARGQRRIYCHHREKTFVILEHVITTPQGAQLALMIEQGETLVDVREPLLLNSTGLSRELLELARKANYRESRQCFPAPDITLSTHAFRVKYNGSNNSLYALVTAEEQSSRVVAILTNYSPSTVE